MSHILSVDTVFFTILGYRMSYIEFLGTVLYLLSVWLISRRNIFTWPVGIVSVLLYMALFYQIRLYADALEQFYYLGTGLYGWWRWSRDMLDEQSITDVSFSSVRAILGWICITVIASVALGSLVSRAHIWIPNVFPEAASYPYFDAFTTVMSFVAMWLMVCKHIESWFYWIVVDIIGIWLYFVKDVKFISLLYAVLLVIAVSGLKNWLSDTANGSLVR
jgi:nicotinamide mononucleotide transporter